MNKRRKLRTCLVSIQNQTDKGQSNHLKRILQISFAVFPKSAVFIQPCKRTFYYPTFWQYSKSMKFITFDNFNFGITQLFYCIGKVISRVTAIRNDLLDKFQILGLFGVIFYHQNCTRSVSCIRCCHHNHMRQTKNIYPYVQLYT